MLINNIHEEGMMFYVVFLAPSFYFILKVGKFVIFVLHSPYSFQNEDCAIYQDSM